MKVSDFDYHLPAEYIAQSPAEKRDHSRLLVLERSTQNLEHKKFYEITEYLKEGDLLVLNDTKVRPANLTGVKENGGARVEVLLVRALNTEHGARSTGQIWECLVKPGKRLNVGSKVVFGNGEVVGKVLEKLESGEQIIEFTGNIEEFMQKHGEIPLPPYINNKSRATNNKQNDKSQLSKRYQTVYANKDGASAAPTAGLNFTPELLKKIKAQGVQIAYVTLHTGLATFKPVYVEQVEEHKMYKESYEIPAETVEKLKKAKRVIAVGTTSVRTLETLALTGKREGETDLFIYPGYKFKMVQAMLTNFHFPRSTLLMLVSAFAGKDFIFRAYKEAREKGYRFFSFGDAMLIL